MKVHIALVGKTSEPILIGIRASEAVDRVYLLHSNITLDIAKKIRSKLSEIGINDITLELIDAFSMDSVVSTIIRIARIETGNDILINITGGTNLMAGAACAASFFVGAIAYYVLDPKYSSSKSIRDSLIILPIPALNHKELTKLQLNVIRKIGNRAGSSSSSLLLQEGLNISPQRLSYNIRQLKNRKLICVTSGTKDSRIKLLSLTDVGRLHLSWSASLDSMPPRKL